MTTIRNLQSANPDFLNPNHEDAKRLIASVSQTAALHATPIPFDEEPRIICRDPRGLTQAIFLVFFHRKFGFLPYMREAEGGKEYDKEVWQSLLAFEKELRVRPCPYLLVLIDSGHLTLHPEPYFSGTRKNQTVTHNSG